jgi:hypothetical protein
MDLLNKILAHILGNKYYANIVNTRGTNRCEISCFIFHTKEEAMKHKFSLDANRSFMFVETISFRSRKQY